MYIVTCYRLHTGFGFVTGGTEHLSLVTTYDYNTLANSHTVRINIPHVKSSQFAMSSPVVAW
jgi:hypothetical protein